MLDALSLVLPLLYYMQYSDSIAPMVSAGRGLSSELLVY